MAARVTTSELRNLDPGERASRLSSLAREERRAPNGEVEDIEERIRAFERRYELDSETMREEVSTGARAETWDLCQWLMLLDVRDRLAAARTPAR
jgi:hypothetical protein